MNYKKQAFWKSTLAAGLFLFSQMSHATSISFSDSVRADTHARIFFQFNEETSNASQHITDASLEQLNKVGQIIEFEAGHGAEMTLVAPIGNESQRLVVMGLGDSDDLAPGDIVATGGKIAQLFAHDDVRKVDIVVEGLNTPIDTNAFASHIAHGVSLGSYRFNRYLKDAVAPNNDFNIVVSTSDASSESYQSLQAIEKGVFLARDFVNTNGAELDPVAFIKQAKSALKGLDIDVDVYDNKKIKKMGMGLLFGVGQGSEDGARLMIAHYKGSDDQPIALVGKGITFDTGGYNIKTHSSIALMKGDMSGAAAVLGTIKALAEQKAKVNLVIAMPLAENMVSETALLPGDIITSMSGKSVEIINTDAEGRLIMADAMWYVQEEYKPSIMLNIATLTGSKIRAVGEDYAALFSNDEDLVKQLTAAGEKVNEPMWRLPLAYGDKLKSTLADLRNTGSGGPGASTAAMFLKEFVKEDTRWAHIDIAGSEMTSSTKNEVPAGAVGYSVRTLVEWINNQ